MSAMAVPSGRTVCQSALAPGSRLPLHARPPRRCAAGQRDDGAGAPPSRHRGRAVRRGQHRGGRPVSAEARGAGSLIERAVRRIVGMRLERRDRDAQPVGERQSVRADRRAAASLSARYRPTAVVPSRPAAVSRGGRDALPPRAWPRRPTRRARAAPTSVCGRSRRNLDLELDQELQQTSGRHVGHVGRSVPACSATMYAAYQAGRSRLGATDGTGASPCASRARRRRPRHAEARSPGPPRRHSPSQRRRSGRGAGS